MDYTLEMRKALHRARIRVRESKLSKRADNPYYNSKYIPYEDIHEVVTDACLSEGLVYYQNASHDGTHAIITHFVSDAEGGELQIGETKLPTPKMTPQDGGSGFSYAKRYGAAALFNLVETKDDDAEDSQQPYRRASSPTPTNKPSPASSAAKAREGQGWDEASFELKGRVWVLSEMNLKQLATVSYSGGNYPQNIVKLCERELLNRVASGDREAASIVEANSAP